MYTFIWRDKFFCLSVGRSQNMSSILAAIHISIAGSDFVVFVCACQSFSSICTAVNWFFLTVKNILCIRDNFSPSNNIPDFFWNIFYLCHWNRRSSFTGILSSYQLVFTLSLYFLNFSIHLKPVLRIRLFWYQFYVHFLFYEATAPRRLHMYTAPLSNDSTFFCFFHDTFSEISFDKIHFKIIY